MATVLNERNAAPSTGEYVRGQQPVGEQARTYAGFLHLARWFGFHMIPILAAIFLLISEQHLLGVLLLIVGVAVLIRGIASVRKVTGRIVAP